MPRASARAGGCGPGSTACWSRAGVGREVWQAAAEYRDAWGRVLAVAYPGAAWSGSGGGVADPHRRMLAVVGTVERLRGVETEIGGLADRLCFRCAVEDQAWAATGRLYRRNPETIRAWTIAALDRLGSAWTAPDPRPATIPPPSAAAVYGLPRAGKWHVGRIGNARIGLPGRVRSNAGQIRS